MLEHNISIFNQIRQKYTKNALFGAGFFQKSQKQRLAMEIWMISVQIKFIFTQLAIRLIENTKELCPNL